jgi:hypothetical protein
MHDHIKHGRMKRTTDTSTVCLRQNDSMKRGLMNPGYSLLILLVSAFVVLIAACTGTSGKEQATGRQTDLPLCDIKGCRGAVFSSDGRLYVYDAKNGSVREIDEASGAKRFLCLSPDKTAAAYLHSFSIENNHTTATKIGVYEIDSGKTADLVLDENLDQLLGAYWTSDNTIMAVSHLNPSTDMCQAFDAREGRSLFVRAVGTLYDISPDGKRIIYYFTPHFSEAPLIPHLKISGVRTEEPDSDFSFDAPVYEAGHPDDRIVQACFAGESRILFVEYSSAAYPGYKLKLADIKGDSTEVVSELPFDFAGLDMDNIIAMEYSEDRSGLYIISLDADNPDAEEAVINLREFLVKDSEVISVNTVPTGLDVSYGHDITINAGHSNDIIITDVTGSGSMTERSVYKYDGKKFSRLPSDQEVSTEALRMLEEYAGKSVGAPAALKIDKIEIY